MNTNTFFAAAFSVNLEKTGANINRYRLEKGYSVADLQEMFNFSSPQAIYKWMKGSCLPTIENLYVLSVIFGVTLEDILVIDGRSNTTSGDKPDVFLCAA